jgi:hypothetical protein
VDSVSFFQALFNPIFRLKIPYLLTDNREVWLASLSCLAPLSEFLTQACATEAVKFSLYHGNSVISDGFPFLNKYSGIAVPLPVFLMNTFGFFGIIPFAIVYVILFIFVEASCNRRYTLLARGFFLLSSLRIVSAIIEDAFALSNSLPLMISLSILLPLASIKFRSRSIVLT